VGGTDIKDWIPVALFIAGLISTAISYIVGKREKQNQIVASTAESIAAGFEKIVDALEKRVERQDRDIKELERKSEDQQEHIRELEQTRRILQARIERLESKNGIDDNDV
jgi:peptidoglycan hydrolase CwlO-like protein